MGSFRPFECVHSLKVQNNAEIGAWAGDYKTGNTDWVHLLVLLASIGLLMAKRQEKQRAVYGF